MSQSLIVANFKSNKTFDQAKDWLNKFKGTKVSGKKVILCPPYTVLELFSSRIQKDGLPFFLGAQNVSPFDEGAYTGEINAKQIKELADYVIIGHSERRKNFKEDEEILNQKVLIALKYGLTPIFCVQGVETPIPQGVKIVAYEPVFAIGTGNPDTPENANAVSAKIKKKNIETVLYGGSVKSQNVKNFTAMDNISGVLVGGACLDPVEFIKIVENA